MKPIRLALVGLGKIARDQHLLAIAATPGIELVAVASQVLVDEPEREYRGVYHRFVELVRSSSSDVDTAPQALVADAFMLGQRSFVDDFAW